MSQILKEVLAANAAYARDFGDKGKLPIPPARRFAVLTCMDARIDPAKMAGLAEGDAHVIRNAGGRASDDAIRSLVISHKLLGTNEWFVIHHTDCGMGMFTEETMRKLLANSLDTAALGPQGWQDTGKGPGSTEAEFIDWLTFKDPIEAVITDIRRIRAHPLVPNDVPIYGYIFDVRTGRLQEVPGARAAGEAARRAAGSAPKPARASKPSAAKPSSAKPPAPAQKAKVAASKAGAAKKKAAPSGKNGAKPTSSARRPSNKVGSSRRRTRPT